MPLSHPYLTNHIPLFLLQLPHPRNLSNPRDQAPGPLSPFLGLQSFLCTNSLLLFLFYHISTFCILQGPMILSPSSIF